MRDREPRFTFAEPPPDADPEPPERPSRERSVGRLLPLLIVLALVAGAAAAVWLLRPAPVMELLRGTPLEPPPTVTRAYKWRDADGGWQMTDRPPPAGTPHEVIEVSSDTNVLPRPPALQDD